MKKIVLLISLFSLSLLAKSQANLDTGLIAHYPFDSSINDVSGNGNHLTNVGASLVADRNGNANKAYYFDGLTDYMHGVATVSDFSVSSFSFSFWIKPETQVSSNPRLITIGPGSSFYHRYFAWIETGGVNTYGISGLSSGGAYNFYMLSNATYVAGSWKHVVMTFHNNTTNLYINGVLDKTTTHSAGVQSFSSDLILQIGAAYHPSSPNALFKGTLDDIRIYNREIQSWEAAQLFNGTSLLSVKKETKENIKVYPNPTNGILNIENPTNSPAKYEVVSAIGQVVQSGSFINNSADLSTLQNGTYFIRITTSEETIISRISKVE